MKKLLLMAISAIASIAGYAQYMPDTTVQICAYWSKGEKAIYECINQTVKKTPDGQEVISSSSSETRIIEVIDETDTSYDLQISYRNIVNDKSTTAVDSIISKMSEGTKIKVRTDELGSIKELLDIGETIALSKEYATIIADEVYAKNKQIEAVIPKEKMLATFSSFLTPEFIQAACLDEIAPLLSYHGARLGLMDEYEMAQSYPLGDITLDGTMKFWVDTEDSDTSYVVIRSATIIEGEKALNAIANLSLKVVKGLTPEDQWPAIEESLHKEFAEKHATAKFEQYSVTTIHVKSGWTTNWAFERIVSITTDDGTNETINSRSIDLKELE